MEQSRWNDPEMKRLWTFERWFVVYRGDEYYIYERAEGDEPERLCRTERTKFTALTAFWDIVETKMRKKILQAAGVDERDYLTVWTPVRDKSLFLMNRQNPIIQKEWQKRVGCYGGNLNENKRYQWEVEMADKYRTVTPMPDYLEYRYKTLKILMQREEKKNPR